MTMQSYRICNATEADFRQTWTWAGDECEWNYGEADFQIWKQSYGTDGMFAAKAEHTDELLGHCITFKHGDKFGYVAMLFVRKDLRSSGIGTKLMRTALKYLEGCNVALAAVPHLTQMYMERYGFIHVPDWRYAEYSIHGPDPDNLIINREAVAGLRLIACPDSRVDLEKLVEYDFSVTKLCTPQRAAWVRLWVQHRNGHGCVVVDADGKVMGYGVIGIGYANRLAIDPVFADNPDIARLIIQYLLNRYSDVRRREVRFFARYRDTNMENIISEFGLEPEVEQFVPMYTKGSIPFDFDRLYCFADFV